MINIKFDSNTVFSAGLVFFFLLIAYRITPPSVDANLKLELSKNRNHIATIDQERSIAETRTMYVDRIDLRERNRISHPKLGPIGWNDDFFMDMTSQFSVKNAATLYFMVGSDDGFKLKIDDREICKFPGDRAYVKQRCSARLTPGEHSLELNYFQGYGHSGLTLEYSNNANGKWRFWGDDSRELTLTPAK